MSQSYAALAENEENDLLTLQEISALTGSNSDGIVISPDDNAPRNLDDFFQTAYNVGSGVAAAVDVTLSSRRPPSTLEIIFSTPWRFMLMIVALGLSSAADAAEMFSIGYVLADAAFQRNILHGDLAVGGAYISGILSLGLIVGGLVAGSAEGRVGRKQVLLAGLAFTTIASLAAAAAPNLLCMIVFRFACGLGIGPILASTAPLATEISPMEQRGFIVSVANSFWTVGLIFNATGAFFVFEVYQASWRIYMIITTLPSIIGGILIWISVPESPRFLALQRRYAQAAESANRVARALEYKGHPLQASELEYHYANFSYAVDPQAESSWQDKISAGWQQIQSVYQKNDWKPILIVQILWVAAAVGGSLGQWINVIFHKVHLPHIYLCFIFLNCTCIPGNIASAVLTDRWGRTKFFKVAMLIAGLSLLSVAGIVAGSSGGSAVDSDNDQAAASGLGQRTAGILFCTSFFYASMTGIYTCLYVMAAELFPTNVRSTGVALCSTGGRIASVLAMFMNGALVNRPAILLSLGATVLLSGGALSILVPPKEMKAMPISDQSAEDEQQFQVERSLSVRRKPSQIKYLAG